MPIYDDAGNPIGAEQPTARPTAPPEVPARAPVIARSSGGNYDDIIDRESAKNGIDPNFVRAVIHQESGGKVGAVSKAGAGGLMQLMPATAKRFGVKDRFDPEQNIAGGTAYLGYLFKRFDGDPVKTLAAYNAGEGTVDTYHGVPPFAETQNYVKSILSRLGQQGGAQQGGAIERSRGGIIQEGDWQEVGIPQEKPRGEITAGDRFRAYMAGSANVGTVLGTGAEMLGRGTGIDWMQDFGAGLRDLGTNAEEYWREGMSEAAKNPTQFWDKVTQSGLESLPGMVAMAIPGMGAAGVAAKLGATTAVAAAAGTAGASVSEGMFSALQNAAQSGDEARSMPVVDLQKSPLYQKALELTGGNVDAAREAVARAAEADVFAKTMPWTTLTSIATGGGALGTLAGRVAGKASGGLVRTTLGAVGKEGAQEAVQSGGEQFIQNQTAQGTYDAGRDLLQGVGEQMAVGGAAGGLLGGGFGAVSHFAGDQKPSTHIEGGPPEAPAQAPTPAAPMPAPATGAPVATDPSKTMPGEIDLLGPKAAPQWTAAQENRGGFPQQESASFGAPIASPFNQGAALNAQQNTGNTDIGASNLPTGAVPAPVVEGPVNAQIPSVEAAPPVQASAGPVSEIPPQPTETTGTVNAPETTIPGPVESSNVSPDAVAALASIPEAKREAVATRAKSMTKDKFVSWATGFVGRESMGKDRVQVLETIHSEVNGSAKQVEEAAQPNGSGGARSEIRQEGQGAAKGSKGVRSGGQGSGQVPQGKVAFKKSKDDGKYRAYHTGTETPVAGFENQTFATVAEGRTAIKLHNEVQRNEERNRRNRQAGREGISEGSQQEQRNGPVEEPGRSAGRESVPEGSQQEQRNGPAEGQGNNAGSSGVSEVKGEQNGKTKVGQREEVRGAGRKGGTVGSEESGSRGGSSGNEEVRQGQNGENGAGGEKVKYPKKAKKREVHNDLGVKGQEYIAQPEAEHVQNVINDIAGEIGVQAPRVFVRADIAGKGVYTVPDQTIALLPKVVMDFTGDDRVRMAHAAETVYHEFGHHIAETVLSQASQEVQDAVDQDYARWVLENRDKPLGKILAARMTPSRATQAEKASDATLLAAGITKEYALSKHEWLADQAARYLMGQGFDGIRNEETRNIVRRIAQLLKDLWKHYQKHLKVETSMQQFMDNLIQAHEQTQLERLATAYEVEFLDKDIGQFHDLSPDVAWQTATNVFEDFTKSTNTFGLYGRTASTQFNKALQNPKFNVFWRRVHRMFQDKSRAISRPADLAPTILPKFDISSLTDAAKTLAGKGQTTGADLEAAHDVLMAGTLAGGGDPLKGHKYSMAELNGEIDVGGGRKVKLNSVQKQLYLEARAAVDASLTETAAANAWAIARLHIANDELRDHVAENPTDADRAIEDAMDLAISDLVDEIGILKATGANKNKDGKSLKQLQAKRDEMQADKQKIKDVFAKSEALQGAGYMPASRFGKYRVTVLNAKGGVELVEHFESSFEANQGRRQIMKDFPVADGFDVKPVREVNLDKWKLYAGVSPETVMLFAEEAGIPTDEVMQEWYKNAIGNRSAMRRMIHRKGYAGYSRDLSRSLSSFLTSNGAYVGNTYHLGDLTRAVDAEEDGGLSTEEQKLLEAVTNKNAGNDFASKARGMMAHWYVLGSLANAGMNLTQTVMQTAPALVARGMGIKDAFKALGKAYADIRKGKYDADLKAAIARAEDDGTIAASEVFHLYQEASRGFIDRLSSKYGTNFAKKAQAFSFLWGAPFAMAEHLNRKATFIVGFRQGVDKGMAPDEAYRFAEEMVMETQGQYAIHNRPNMARSGVGAMAFTFKQFTLGYLEQLVRQAKSGPQGRKAAGLQFATLILFSGLLGAIGEEDVEDVIDTVAQVVFGKAFVSRIALQDAAKDLLGKELADFVLHGISAGLPLDLSGKMGMSNLFPGTAWFKPSEKEPLREAAEFFGPAGRTVESLTNAAQALLGQGDFIRAGRIAAPKAVQDLLKGYEMAATGEARTAYGSKMVDASKLDAIIQAIGFQPAAKARFARVRYPLQDLIEYRNKIESSIAAQIARGMADNDYNDVAKARRRMQDWNRTNPRFRVEITQQQIERRLKNLTKSPHDTMLSRMPPEVRQTVEEELDDEE